MTPLLTKCRLFLLLGFMVAAPYPVAADNVARASAAWDYNGEGLGDEGWGEISPDFASCTVGSHQSPINISYTTLADLPSLDFNYQNEDAHMEMKEHALVITLSGKNTLTIGKTLYRLVEIRFHDPSEHSILGHDAPMEIQLVHHNDRGELLIVAVLADIGRDNAALETISEHINTQNAGVSFSPASFLPASLGYFSYPGSLTWPPCTEGVEWRILKTPITMGSLQFETLARLMGRNSRMPQPVYMRQILESKN